MAYDGIEVEVKLKADKSVADALKERLVSSGAKQTRQVDVYFDSRNDSFLKASPLNQWLSVRNRAKGVIINHKRFHFDGNGLATHCDEVDLPVTDAETATRLLNALGYDLLITVDKQRTEGLLDTFLVSVDEVVDLGHFVEIEATESLGSVDDTRQAILKFADELGLSNTEVDHKGYPHLLLEQRVAGTRPSS